jgi:hypothetical protein
MPPETEEIPTAIDRLKSPTTETKLLRTAVGSFDVHSRLWPADGAEPIVTDAVARRRMVDDQSQYVRPERGHSRVRIVR